MYFVIFFVFFTGSFVPNDPLLHRQIHIKNDGDLFGGLEGEDHNIIPAWEKGFSGKGVPIVIVDDGCNPAHSDLFQNYDPKYSFNFATNDVDPSYNKHQFILDSGTKWASLSSGVANDQCTVGVAFNSSFSCVNVLSNLTAQTNYLNGVLKDSDVKNSIRVIRYISPCSVSPYCRVMQYSEELETLFRKTKSFYVTSLKGAIQLNEDAAYSQFGNIPEIWSFAEISQRGGQILTSIRSASIVASVVTGGCHYASESGVLSAYLSDATGFDNSCTQTTMPAGNGAPIVAGIIALILEANQNLNNLDLMAIIATSSVKNDNSSKSWQRNSANIWFSDIYGFGRIDADAAVTLAKDWETLGNPIYARKDITFSNYEPKVIPSFLNGPGYTDVKFTIDDNSIKTIDHTEIILHFNHSCSDYSLFRIWLISPSGTKSFLKDVAAIVEPQVHVYKIVARNFFGESSKGTWTLRFMRENTGIKEYTLIKASLIIAGSGKAIKNKTNQKESKANPFDHFPEVEGVSIEFSSYTFQCNTIASFTVKTEQQNITAVPYDIIISKKSPSGQRYEPFSTVKANSEGKMFIPCTMESGEYEVRAINPIYALSTKPKSLKVINGNIESQSFLSPLPYSSYILSPIVQIPIVLNFKRTEFEPFKREIMAFVTLYDTESDIVWTTRLQTAFGSAFIYNLNFPCRKCVLTATPFEFDNYSSNCHTLVTTISVYPNNETSPGKFPIKWKNNCPAPKDLLIDNNDDGDDGKVTNRKTVLIIIIFCSSVCAIAVIFVIAYKIKQHCNKKKLDPKIESLLDSHY